MRTLGFFNNKGGVGKTTLLYHIACLLADRGVRVLAVDLDPQANLSSMFLEEDTLERLWPRGDHPLTIFGALRPIIRGLGDVESPHVEPVGVNLGLLVGDLALSTFEDRLSDAWLKCHNRDEAAYRTMSAFHRGIQLAATGFQAEWVLVDVGPNLGAINRAALIAVEHVVIPLNPDLFSLQGLRNLGPSLRSWRETWTDLRRKTPDPALSLPAGQIAPIGYVIIQHGTREHRPVKAYQRWIERFPGAYRESVVEASEDNPPAAAQDPYCLGMLRHYRSLIPMGMEARKPVFALRPADGAIGAHAEATRHAYTDFLALARRIADRCGAGVP
ncbi:MAG: ParA family protein [Gammaproteobacteria bacterium]